VPYLGGGLELSLRSGGRSSARLDPPFIAVTAKDPSEADEIREAVERLYARQAALVFPSLLEACLLRAAPRRLPRPELRIRRMKARWGSCDTAKRIVTLNVHLLRYAPEAIEYVIMHELAHLRWRGHGPRFYALLAALCPRWKELRSSLKETPID
jgi:predicted metal-dependent hydrolase